MWPWEHVLFAYLLFSLGSRAAGTVPNSRIGVLLLAIGAVLPDLIDKPLAWQWDVLSASYGIGHSIFVAVPLAIVGIVVAGRLGSPSYGGAFAVGYLSHLFGDLLSRYLRDGEIAIERVMWPIMTRPSSTRHESVVGGFRFYLARSLEAIRADGTDLSLAIQGGVMLLAIALWIVDGMPGLR